MLIARQSTARTVMIGPVLDADGVAVTDGVVADFKISKNGGAPAALNGSATLTHRNTGHYSLALTASDLDTVGQAEVVIDDTVNGCAVKEITVIEEAVYDAMFAASAAGYQVPIWAAANSTVNLSATTVATVTTTTTATNLTNAPTNGDLTATMKASVNAEVDTALADYDAPTNTEMEARTIVSADYATAANLATVAGYLDTEIAAILADTNELQTDWVNGGRLDLLIDAIKAKTDVLTFSNTNHIYADVRSLLGQTTIGEADRFTGL